MIFRASIAGGHYPDDSWSKLIFKVLESRASSQITHSATGSDVKSQSRPKSCLPLSGTRFAQRLETWPNRKGPPKTLVAGYQGPFIDPGSRKMYCVFRCLFLLVSTF